MPKRVIEIGGAPTEEHPSSYRNPGAEVVGGGGVEPEGSTLVPTIEGRTVEKVLPRVMYLVAPTIQDGADDALRRGWIAIGRTRFVTPWNGDVRIVTRFQNMVPFRGAETPLIKSAGYESGGGLLAQYQDRWLEDMGQFEEFVRVGNGRWYDV